MEYIIKIKKNRKTIFQDRWVWKMAWRDAQHNFSRLFLFIASIIIGIAALVAINSFNENLQNDIGNQSKELLGADFYISSNKPFDPEITSVWDTLQAPQAMDARFASMVLFRTPAGGTRLIQVIAMDGDFPFYGSAETLPKGALDDLDKKVALLDESLAIQFEVSSDDSLKLGNVTFPVGGVVQDIPGTSGISTTFAPSVYISMDYLEETGLIQYGSRINYRKYFKTDSDEESEALLTSFRPIMKKHGYWDETVEERKEDLGEAFGNLYRFFNLLGFIALILGCIGVASSVHIYVQEKRSSVAILRCMGTSGWQAFNIFFIQAVMMGILGSMLGAMLGIGIQYLIPMLLEEFLPLDISVKLSWLSIGEGLLLGLIISVLFSFLPLTNVRNIPPLAVLRTGFDKVKRFSKFRILIIGLALTFPLLFAVYQTGSIVSGLVFFSGLVVSFLILALVANILIFLIRKFFPSSWSFNWRQGLANLFRPQNQTVVLVVVIGLGAFLISTLSLIQNSLLNQVEFIGGEERPNTVLFDIQPSQKDGVVKLVEDYELPVQQLVPIVTTRLSSLNGSPISELQKDTTDNIPNWALTREYRVTYRDHLIDSETLTDGDFMSVHENPEDTVMVTISVSMAENLELEIGDEVVFDVQGVPITTRIGGFRDVDWQRIQTNFIFVFPTGVLEQAPQFYVLMTRSESKEQSSSFQQDLVAGFPNVSAIDLTLILNTIDDFMSKVAFVIQFMALFSIATGLVVLSGAVINSKYLRMKENVLLRTIGALKKQIVRITLIEYGYLGIFAGLTGILLSLIASWGLAIFFFEIVFFPDLVSLAAIWGGIVVLTMLVGWINTRSVIRTTPLEILRKEV